MWPGPRPTSIPSDMLVHPADLATSDMGRKLGGSTNVGGAGSPSNTMWSGQRPTSVPRLTLIQLFGQNTPALQRERTDKQAGQRSGSIGLTILQTVAQILKPGLVTSSNIRPGN